LKTKFPLVSIVVPSFNSAKTIGACVESIQNQTYPNLEIIVVDDGSTDETLVNASKYGVHVIALKENRGAPHAMNVGAEKAEGKHIFFLDSDIVAPQRLIERAVNLLIRNTDCAAVGGWYVPTDGHKAYSLLLRIGMYNRLHATRQVQIFEGKVDPKIYGCFLGFRRNVFDKEKFSEKLKAIYDREFMARLTSKGYKVLFSRNLFVFHPTPPTLSGILKTVLVQSMWMSIAGRKSPVIIKYHLSLLLMTVLILFLSWLVSPMILALVFLTYLTTHLLLFLRVRRYFLITPKKLLILAALTCLITIATLAGFTLGFIAKPKSYWK